YNMPLRSLMYVGRAYEQIVKVKDRYKKALVKLPTPEFYTFYNGSEVCDKEKILCLSDAFQIKEEEPELELKVKVININPSQDHEILKRCPILKEYGMFVDMVRTYQDQGEPDAIEQAIYTCIDQGVLVEYLRRKGSQVNNMLVAEYDYDLDIQVQREEAKEEGKAEGKAEAILELLEELDVVPEELKSEILNQPELAVLKRWLKLAAKVESVEQFKDKM
ncbi:MAG: hypothetical protein RRY06_09825, partial [Lachnospiraceae bacterium]